MRNKQDTEKHLIVLKWEEVQDQSFSLDHCQKQVMNQSFATSLLPLRLLEVSVVLILTRNTKKATYQ